MYATIRIAMNTSRKIRKIHQPFSESGSVVPDSVSDSGSEVWSPEAESSSVVPSGG
jgi:hypothetical protein